MAESNFAVLNLGSQRVSGAVFSKARNGDLILKNFAFAEMQGDPSASQGESTRLPQLRIAVLELADRLKLKGKPVWYAIAGHVVFTRFVKLPPFDDDKADQMVEFEARQNVPFPINEVIWDYEFIGEKSGGEREVALVAIKAETLNDINEQVEAGGVKVCGVDLAPLVVYNAFRFSYPDVEESTLIIDLGSKSTNLIFVEGQRVFTRNILVGGSTVTGAIAKELGVPFGEAEHAKRAQGYVAPGGAYEPNPDENVEAISKIMRNTMTRLHGEVVRTINFYRSQQGGTSPRRIFLCGGGAQTALIAEFFQEKINLPVEVLNPLRGVQMDRRVNQADASANSPSMTELVGLALRHAGSAPLEVELVPDRVAAARDSAKRAPMLVMATICLFAALLAGVFYFITAEKITRQKLEAGKANLADLKDYDEALKNVDKQQTLLTQQSQQLERVVNDRTYWKDFLHALNNAYENEFMWMTTVEVLKDGNATTPPLWSGAAPSTTPTTQPGTGTTTGQGTVPAGPVYELSVRGLWRRNDSGPNEQLVHKYFDVIKKLDTYFAPSENKAEVTLGIEEDRYAYDFKFRLPLAKGMKFDK